MIKNKHRHLINFRQLTRIMGWLLMIESVFMFIPGFTSLAYGEDDWLVFMATALLTGVCGLVCAKRAKPTSSHMGKRDGFLLTAMVWVVFSVFGLIPFLFGSKPLGLSDAFFEAMSGFTTTGATVMGSFDGLGHGLHLWRALMQWIGGMGIILFTLAVIPMLNHSGGMQMFNAEVTGITHDKIRPRISQTAKSLWLVYLLLTIVLILLLWAGPMDLFQSVCHAFGTISTGGYATDENGIAIWDNSVYIKLVLTVFMFLGGVNFGLIYKGVRGDFSHLRNNEVLRVYLWAILGMTILFVGAVFYHGQALELDDWLVDPLFQVVSIITSTGFTATGFNAWGYFALALTFVMMFSGACAGSTSGGSKIDRVIYLFKYVKNELYRCIYPNSIQSVKVNGKVVNPDLLSKVVAFMCIYMLLVVLGGLVLSCLGVPTVDAFFSSFSCISNTGLGAGVTGYGGNYEILPDTAKWVLSILMLTGRLEIFTVLVILTPAFWRR